MIEYTGKQVTIIGIYGEHFCGKSEYTPNSLLIISGRQCPVGSNVVISVDVTVFVRIVGRYGLKLIAFSIKNIEVIDVVGLILRTDVSDVKQCSISIYRTELRIRAVGVSRKLNVVVALCVRLNVAGHGAHSIRMGRRGDGGGGK